MRQRFDTLMRRGVDGVIIAGAIDKGANCAIAPRRWHAAGVCFPRQLPDVDLIRPDNMQARRLSPSI
jgi:LacI family transcriptional regulator of maltose regulon